MAPTYLTNQGLNRPHGPTRVSAHLTIQGLHWPHQPGFPLISPSRYYTDLTDQGLHFPHQPGFSLSSPTRVSTDLTDQGFLSLTNQGFHSPHHPGFTLTSSTRVSPQLTYQDFYSAHLPGFPLIHLFCKGFPLTSHSRVSTHPINHGFPAHQFCHLSPIQSVKFEAEVIRNQLLLYLVQLHYFDYCYPEENRL